MNEEELEKVFEREVHWDFGPEGDTHTLRGIHSRREEAHFTALNGLTLAHDKWRGLLQETQQQLAKMEASWARAQDAVTQREEEVRFIKEELSDKWERQQGSKGRIVKCKNEILEHKESEAKARQPKNRLKLLNKQRLRRGKKIMVIRKRRDETQERFEEQRGITENVWAQLYEEEIPAVRLKIQGAMTEFDFFLELLEGQIEITRKCGYDKLISAYVERIAELEIPSLLAPEVAVEKRGIVADLMAYIRKAIEQWNALTRGLLESIPKGGEAAALVAERFAEQIPMVRKTIREDILAGLQPN